MPEALATSRIESAPPPELSTRKGVLDAVNKSYQRWRYKIDGLHRKINPRVEIDDLADRDNPAVNPKQRKQFREFRVFQKGFRWLEGGNGAYLSDSLEDDTIPTSFNNPETLEEYKRNERLNIAPLIESDKEEMAVIESQLQAARSASYSPAWWIEKLEKDLREVESDIEILEENSDPYEEVYPETFDEANPVGRARIAEEARRVWKTPTAATGNSEADWNIAKERLQKARLLKIPEKVVVIPEAKIPKKVDTVEAATTEALRGINNGSSTVSAEEPIRVSSSKTPDIINGRVVNKREMDALSKRTYSGLGFSEDASSSNIFTRIGDSIAELRARGLATVGSLIGRIRSMGESETFERARTDPETTRRVARLMKIKMPESSRRQLRVSLVPVAALALAALLATIPRDTIATPPLNEQLLEQQYQEVHGNLGLPSNEGLVYGPNPPLAGEVPTQHQEPIYPEVVNTGNPALGQPTPESGLPQIPESGTGPAWERDVSSIPSHSNFSSEDSETQESLTQRVIQPGETVRGIIEKELKKADPSANLRDIDRAASVVLWEVGLNTPEIENLDNVQPGKVINIPPLAKLNIVMKNIDPDNPVIDQLNKAKESRAGIDSAKEVAHEYYKMLISKGGR